jgi:hypothetical protein
MLYPIIPQAEIEMVFLVSQFMGNKCIVEEEKLKKFNKSNIKKLRRAHTREREKSKVSQDLEDALSSPSRNKATPTPLNKQSNPANRENKQANPLNLKQETPIKQLTNTPPPRPEQLKPSISPPPRPEQT